MVVAGNCAGGSATGEGELRVQPFQEHMLVAEEGDGQARDGVGLLHRGRIDPRGLKESQVDGVVRGVQVK